MASFLTAAAPNIHLLALGYSQDFKFYGHDAIAERLIAEVKRLFEKRLSIFWYLTKSYKLFRVIVLNFAGDNLGLNGLFCFKESFTATRFCRMCLCTYSDIQENFREIPELLRNRNNYDCAIANLTTITSQETGITVFLQLLSCQNNPAFHSL